MPSIINVGGDKYLTIDRMWRDNGADAQYALVGGQKILVDKGCRPKATICQHGSTFFYQDGKPVTRKEDVEWLPEPFRTSALKFIEKQEEKAKPVKIEVFETKEEAVEAAVPAKKRGRPKNEAPKPKVIEIKDEQSYVAAGGVVI